MKINKPFCVNVQLILLDKNGMYVDWVISEVILSFSAYMSCRNAPEFNHDILHFFRFIYLFSLLALSHTKA